MKKLFVYEYSKGSAKESKKHLNKLGFISSYKKVTIKNHYKNMAKNETLFAVYKHI